mmetsp:Transcript_29353/g.55702  ORF Transcript_29353/g.55702 Transcript_29353/m.55702 type:complete len:222 (-) Transcript_29353:587-1252(-)
MNEYYKSIPHNSTQTLSTVQSFDCIISFVNSIKGMSNEMIHRKLSINATLNQLGNIPSAFKPSKCSSFPGTTCDKLEWTSADFVSRGCNSNHTRCTPSSMCTFQSGSHHIHISCTVKGVVHSPLRHLHNMCLNWFVKFRAVNSVSCPKCHSCSKLLRIDIYCNNARSPRHLCALDHCQTHCPQTKHSHTRIHLHLACIPNSPQTRTHTTSKQTCLLQSQLL